jgi:CubicO group peptidase (beta-lactamase class C family)
VPDGLTPAGLERFDAVAAKHVEDGGAPGTVALVARGEQVHVCAEGSLRIGGPPVARDSLFRIASTTKPVTGAATMALVGEGLLALDEPVARLLPELAAPRVLRHMDGRLDDTVPAARAITVHDLLTFTFGFGMTLGMFLSEAPWPIAAATHELDLYTIGPPQPDATPDPDTWMARLGSLPLVAQPGERWLYNTSATVLGVLLSRAAGAPIADVYRTRVFEPLGMRDTAFFASDTARLAAAYMPTPDGVELWDEPAGQWSRPPALADGGAGLVSTVDDLLAFARMLQRGGEPVLTTDAVAQMTTNHLTAEQQERDGAGFLDGRGWDFCQSVVTAGPRGGAYGWDGGLGTSWLVDPVRDLAVIVLTQRLFESAHAPEVHTDLQDAAYAALA